MAKLQKNGDHVQPSRAPQKIVLVTTVKYTSFN